MTTDDSAPGGTPPADGSTEPEQELRKAERVDFRRSGIRVAVQRAPDETLEHRIAVGVDLSAIGIGLLMPGGIDPKTRVDVDLPRNDSTGTETVPGMVVRSFEVGRGLYRVGIVFMRRIDPAEYVLRRQVQ